MADLLVSANPKCLQPHQYKGKYKAFLQEFYSRNETPLGTYQTHIPWIVDVSSLIDFDSVLAFTTLNYPSLLLPLFDEACMDYQADIASQLLKKTIYHVRFNALPPLSEFIHNSIGDVMTNESTSMVQITGTIVRISGIKMLEVSKMYECQNPKCKYRFSVYADPEQGNILPHPRYCPKFAEAEGLQNGEIKRNRCNSCNIREIEEDRICVDYQEIRIQDRVEQLAVGSAPRSITVIIQADLVDRFNPGDDVTVVGTVIRNLRYTQRSIRSAIDISINANNVMLVHKADEILRSNQLHSFHFQAFWEKHTSTKQEMVARDFIIRSICPQLYGMYFVKLSLLLSLIGGADTTKKGGIQRRSNIHMLMVGDPGCGKSQLLRFAAAVSPRSVLTTGVGTTGAGLTCTVLRGTGSRENSTDWSLEAGAMVLANGGTCCIDEFNSIKESDRTTIHEAMEQQTLSVAKAGMIIKLKTKASIIASCNPKGSYDMTLDISANTNIASPLLSRFDIILVMIDNPQKEWDKFVSTFLLTRCLRDIHPSTIDSSIHWDMETLKSYLYFIKSQCQPTLSLEARLLIMKFFSMQRQCDERESGRTTVRLLESLMRLSEAHAMLMFRNEVQVMDAVMAILIVAHSQSKLSLLDSDGDVAKEDFPADPTTWYSEKEQHVFGMINYSLEQLRRDVSLFNQDGKISAIDEFPVDDTYHF